MNALRLFLAICVLVSHVGVINGHDNVLRGIGPLAVNCFFVISGFLIAGSQSKKQPMEFWLARIRRIYPGYIICLFATSFIFGPLATKISGHSLRSYFSQPETYAYILKNLSLIQFQNSIGLTPVTPQGGLNWNGPLWTLKFELLSYFVIFLLGIFGYLKSKFKFWGIFISILIIDMFCLSGINNLEDYAVYFRFILLALSGASLWIYKDSIKINFYMFVSSLVFVLYVYFFLEEYKWITNKFVLVAGLPFAYLIVAIGTIPNLKISEKYDFSYGAYIYGAPCTQLIAMTQTWNRFGFVGSTLFSLALTSVFAILSALLVENRFRFRNHPSESHNL